MSGGFVKLYGSILTSSVWLEDDATLRVWIAMLATADENGYVGASVGGLAHVSRVSRDACQAALDKFMAPDPDSRTEEHEGRRIEKADGGWKILNHRKYRDLRTPHQISEAERKAEYRRGQRQSGTERDSPECPKDIRIEGEGEADALSHSLTHSPSIEARPWDADGIVLRFCRLMPNVESWQHLLAGYREGMGLAKGRATQEQIAQACLEAEVLPGDMSPRRFRRVLEQVMEKPEEGERRKGPRAKGRTGVATTLIMNLRQKKNPQYPNSIPPTWSEGLTEHEKTVVQPFLARIFADNPNAEGTLVAQLARALEESE